MKEKQKRFLGAALAASSVLGIVAPSMTAMATTIDDEANATADQLRSVINEYSVKLEQNPNFANYHRVKYAAERLAKYSEQESNDAIKTLSSYDSKVFTADIIKVVDKMDEFAQSKKMQMFDDLLNTDIPNLAKLDSESADYLKGRIDVWGKAVVFEVDPNYSKATDSIMKVKELREAKKFDDAEDQVNTAKNDIKNIKTYDINGEYLESKLKIEEDRLKDAIENSTLKVKSAEAINAREIKVVFNKEVDEDSAENEDNYTIYIGKDDEKRDEFSADLQDDNKTVILQFDNKDGKNLTDEYYLENGQSYKLEVRNVLDTKGDKVSSYESGFSVFNDKDAPELLKTEYLGSTIKFTFNEPLSELDIPTVKIDNTTIKNNNDEYTFSKDAGEYTLSVSLKNAPDKVKDYGDHTVKLSGVTDCAGNTADMFKTEYTANEDNEKPEVEEITSESENSFRVKFDTEVDEFTLDNVEVKKGSHKFAEKEFDGEPFKVEDKDNTYEVTLKNDNDSDNPLYDDDEDRVDLNIKIKDYKGTNDVMGDDYSKRITLSKDDDAPTVKSDDLNRIERKKDKNGDYRDYIAIIFDEDLDVDSAVATKISVSRDGVKKTVDDAKVDEDKKNKLLIELKDNENLGTGKYLITLEKGAVKDKAGNKNEAVTTKLNYNNDNSDSFTIEDEDAIKVNGNNSDVPGENPKLETDQEKNIIKIKFGVKMSDSAIELKNYKVDGVKLNNGSYDGTTIAFTDEDKKNEVEIKLAKGNFDEDYEHVNLVLSQDIKADDGRYLVARDKNGEPVSNDKDFTKEIALLDDTAPEIDTIELVKDNSNDTTTKTLKVKFTEDLAAIDKEEAIKDFKIKVSDDKKTIESVTKGEDADTLIIKLERTINISTSGRITLQITDNKDDNDGDISLTDDTKFKNQVEATDPIKVKDVVVEGAYNKVPQVTVNYGDNQSKVISGESKDKDSIVTKSASLRLTKNTDNIDNVVLKKDDSDFIKDKDLKDKLMSSDGYELTKGGKYELTVEDTYGNITTVKVTIDLTGPKVVVSIDGKEQESKTDYLTNKPVTLKSSDEDIVSSKLTDGSGKVIDGTLKDGYNLTEKGSYTLKAVNKLGNETVVKVTIDTVKPVVVLKDKTDKKIDTATPDAYEVQEYAKLISEDKDIASAKLVKDTNNEIDVDLAKGYELTEVGAYKLVVTDKAGNVTTVTITIK